jgi:hypothetical protein
MKKPIEQKTVNKRIRICNDCYGRCYSQELYPYSLNGIIIPETWEGTDGKGTAIFEHNPYNQDWINCQHCKMAGMGKRYIANYA